MVVISAISLFIMSFYFFEVHVLKFTKHMKNQQNKVNFIKQDYYFAMTSPASELLSLPKYSVEEMGENYYKIKIISDDIFSDLFVIRKK